jgi:hypothetical protein
MPRPGCLDRPADAPQRLPAALWMHPRQAEVPRHPGRHLGAAPQPAAVGRRPQPLGQGGQHGLGQQARRPAIPPPLVAQRRGAEGVVAGRQFLHPARREGQHLADLEEGPPLRQQPDRLMVPRLGHIAGRPVARLQLPNGKMINDPCHGCAPRPWSSRLPPHARAGDRRPHSEPITRKRYQARPQEPKRRREDDRANADWPTCSSSETIRWRPCADPGQKRDTGDRISAQGG